MNTDTLRFYSRSKEAAPGRGAGEEVAAPSAYAALARTPGWRRVLSNFHVCPFRFRGKTYRSIEHAFQATKIALADPARAASFAADSGSALGLGDGATAQAARKLVRLTPAQLAVWGAVSQLVMAEAASAKYAQCEEARRVLLATGRAHLWHIVPRGRPVRFRHLERIRADLRLRVLLSSRRRV